MARGDPRYMRRERRKDWPTPGELRNPCVVLKTLRQADSGYGYDLKVDVQARPWCKIDNVSGQWVKGENEEAKEITHVIWCRKNDTWTPEKDWFVLFGEKVYRILKARQVDQRIYYWKISCMEEGTIDQYGYDNIDTAENPHDVDNPEDEPAPTNAGFPLWS